MAKQPVNAASFSKKDAAPTQNMNPTSTTENANIFHLSACHRLHERFPFGMEVLWKGRIMPLANWSLGGVGFTTAGAHWPVGTTLKLTFRIPLAEGNTHLLPVSVVIVHSNPNGYTGMRFTKLDSDSIAILRYIATQVRNNEAITEIGILNALHNAPEAPLPFLENATTASEKNNLKTQKMHPITGYALVLLLSFGILYLAVTSVYHYFFTATAPFAAVSAPAVTIHAHASGWLHFEDALQQQSAFVKKGEAIATISNPDLQAALTASQAQQELHREKIVILEAYQEGQSRFFKHYQNIAQSQHQQESVRLTTARALLVAAENQYNRVKNLADNGFATQHTLEQAENTLTAARSDFRNAQEGIQQASTNIALAEENFFFTGSRVEGGTPHDITKQISLLRAEQTHLAAQHAILEQRQQSLTIFSPCDCLIRVQHAAAANWVTEKMPLFTLQYADKAAYLIEARIPQDIAARLQQGNSVTFRLTEQSNKMHGEIVMINRVGNDTQRYGLPLNSADANTFATALISPNTALPETVFAGMPAMVSFELADNPFTRFGNWLKRF